MTGNLTCDDGNTDNRDGCSSSCQEEVGYRCYNGSSSSPSACVYEGVPLTVSLEQVDKSLDLNQGVLQFAVSPSVLITSRMDLPNQVILSCDAESSVSSISYSAGILKITVDYSTDLEGQPCSLIVSFDSLIIRSPNATLDFSAVSQTLPLIIPTNVEQHATVQMIFGLLAYTALGLFVLSLAHKMIGAELLSCLQIVYLSGTLYHTPSYFLS